MRLTRPEKECEILIDPGTLDPKYYQTAPGDRPSYEGVPFALEEIPSLGGKFSPSRVPVWLNDDVVTSGEIEMVTDFESVERGCLLKQGEGFVPDPLADELALFVKTSLGLLVILGCAHRGMINTIYYGLKVTGMDHVYMAVGGTHLAHAPETQLTATIAALKELGIEHLGASHCTGLKTGCRLAFELPDVFFHSNAGARINFAGNQMQVRAF